MRGRPTLAMALAMAYAAPHSRQVAQGAPMKPPKPTFTERRKAEKRKGKRR